MNRITTATLSLLMLVNCQIIAASAIDVQKTEAMALISRLGALDAKIENFELEYSSDKDAVAYGILEFCTTNTSDAACQGKSSAVQQGEQTIPVSHIAWGFVVDGTESENDFNDQPEQVAAGVQPGFNYFKILRNTSQTFGDHLCIEVHFKDSSEFPNMSQSMSDKTVVLCAIANDISQSLIDIDHVDPDNSDGFSNNAHASISGWRCYNPHGQVISGSSPTQYEDDLGNAGNALGYMSIEEQQYRLVEGISGYFSSCFPAMDTVNND